MKKDDRMSYKGFIFEVNPGVIKIKHRSRLVQSAVPYGSDSVRNLGRRASEVSGEGEFIGENCTEQFERLRQTFCDEGSGLLLLPGFEPMYAFFDSLELLEEPSDKLIRYAFSFCEDTSARHFEDSPKRTYTAEGGETLWDISYKFGIKVEKLLDCNTNIMRPDAALSEGEAVRLC